MKNMKDMKSGSDHESASQMMKTKPKMRLDSMRIRVAENGYIASCEMRPEKGSDGMAPWGGPTEEHVLSTTDDVVAFIKKHLKG